MDKVLDTFAVGVIKNRQFLALQGTCSIAMALGWVQAEAGVMENGDRHVGFIIAKTNENDFVEGLIVVSPFCSRKTLNAPSSIKVGTTGHRGKGTEKLRQIINALQQCPHYSTLKVVRHTPPIMAPAEIQQELQEHAVLSKTEQAAHVLAIRTKAMNYQDLTKGEQLILKNQSLVNKVVDSKEEQFVMRINDPKCPAIPTHLNLDAVKRIRAYHLDYDVEQNTAIRGRSSVQMKSYQPRIANARMGGFSSLDFHTSFAKLALDYTIVIHGDANMGTGVLCQALARGFAEAEGTPHFICCNTVADLKKCANAGKIKDNTPLVFMGLSHDDRACTCEIARCIMKKGYAGSIRIPPSTPRFISTSSSAFDWFPFMGHAGQDAVNDIAMGTVWVDVRENVANVTIIKAHEQGRLQRIKDHMTRLFNTVTPDDA